MPPKVKSGSSLFGGGSRIFQMVGGQPLSLWENLFGKIFAENCMKMKEIGPRGRVSLEAPLDSPMLLFLFDLPDLVKFACCEKTRLHQTLWSH